MFARLFPATLVAFIVFTSSAEDAGKRPLRVALYEGPGATGKGIPSVDAQLKNVAEVNHLKAEQFASEPLQQFDVVIFTGGSGSAQANAVGEAGREKIREFIRGGGGYLGICAGAYVACSGFSWGAKVLDAKTVSSKWMRGRATLKIELTDTGKQIFGDKSGQFDILYANGPILKPAGEDSIPDYVPLAYFRTETALNGTPKGVQVNSPAIAAGTLGKGRVIAISPHPEQTAGLEQFVPRAVSWLAGRTKVELPVAASTKTVAK